MKHESDFPDSNPPSWPGRRIPHPWSGHHISEHRPSWWPENEEWPPRDRRQWRRIRRSNPFFRRMGLVFAIFNIFSIIFFAVIVGFILNALSIIHFSGDQFQWLVPFGRVFFAIVVAILILSVLNIRRMSMPLDDLLDASNKVAEGDFSARVDERGPREVRSLAQAFNSMASRLQLMTNKGVPCWLTFRTNFAHR